MDKANSWTGRSCELSGQRNRRWSRAPSLERTTGFETATPTLARQSPTSLTSWLIPGCPVLTGQGDTAGGDTTTRDRLERAHSPEVSPVSWLLSLHRELGPRPSPNGRRHLSARLASPRVPDVRRREAPRAGALRQHLASVEASDDRALGKPGVVGGSRRWSKRPR